jgi:two-component system chemotaxis response regulator CheB
MSETMGMTASINVLVVDDSLLMQRIITRLLESDPRIHVVATAADGYQAVEQVFATRPDVVTMDVQMPRADGLTALRQIMQSMPTPVVMLSAFEDASAAVQALELGAVDLVTKPSGTVSVDLYKVREELITKVKLASLVNIDRTLAHLHAPVRPTPVTMPLPCSHHHMVAIAASTGGPQALDRLCRQLPAELPASLLIVQHMPANFTTSFAHRLDAHCALPIKEATEGEIVHLGAAYVAPGGRHMVVVAENEQPTIHLLDTPLVNSVRPSADVLMASVAEMAGAPSLGVVLTGMGRDGTEGLARIKQAGGATLAQDRESSVVFGMPRAAIEQGVVDEVLPLSEIPSAIVRMLKEMDRHG